MNEFSFQDLVNYSVEILQHYEKDDVDSKDLEEILHFTSTFEDKARTFLFELVIGCMEHSNILNVILDGFYDEEITALPSDRLTFKIFAYLLLLRHDEINHHLLSDFILMSTKPAKIIKIDNTNSAGTQSNSEELQKINRWRALFNEKVKSLNCALRSDISNQNNKNSNNQNTNNNNNNNNNINDNNINENDENVNSNFNFVIRNKMPASCHVTYVT
ncbi:hypothetical protein HELRODRAFT_169573 [Helobdella robusta]|uniref:Uncharacterized protein n=1 Tax=Helobdella robusta TaxID=6412 RepID=T1F243_HELRO|nr:hypothetical protein HELRODRAFT_169573 [Helobdella robusta]ESO07877.1 hypothetical protein HELRODRAFT_169573 [Helobdella robusta]